MNTVSSIPAALAIATNASAVLQMLDMFDEFATDLALENNGAWVTFKNGTAFKIARANNDAYAEAISKAMDENREALLAGNDAAKALSEKLMNEVIAATLLKGWKTTQTIDGVETTADAVKYKGAEVAYSKEVAVQMLGHRDFREWVKRQSEHRDYFKAILIAEASKN